MRVCRTCEARIRVPVFFCPECGAHLKPWPAVLTKSYVVAQDRVQVAYFRAMRALGFRQWVWPFSAICLFGLRPDEMARATEDGRGWIVRVDGTDENADSDPAKTFNF